MAVAVKNGLLVCTQLECETTEEMQASIEQAKVEGADLVELCIDSMEFSHISQVDKLIQHATLPAIVSYSLLCCELCNIHAQWLAAMCPEEREKALKYKQRDLAATGSVGYMIRNLANSCLKKPKWTTLEFGPP